MKSPVQLKMDSLIIREPVMHGTIKTIENLYKKSEKEVLEKIKLNEDYDEECEVEAMSPFLKKTLKSNEVRKKSKLFHMQPLEKGINSDEEETKKNK